ncbi:D-aminoacyl-tRNA deacylase [subsurface metagenome]
MMQLIDTHSHIYLKHFDNDIDQVIERARNEHITTIVLPNIDSTTIEPLHSLVSKYPDCLVPLMGLHPTHVKENFREELEKVKLQLEKYKYKGIGEIGIDLYRDKSFFEQQVYVFEQQLVLAISKNLPVVIHARVSFNEIMQIVRKKEYKNLRGIFHAFTGNKELANEIINMGFMIGVGGILTFKNSGLSETVEAIDINHIVVETDSPYLTPIPFRGKRNESSYLKFVIEKLAEVKNLTIDEVAKITTKNAIDVFGL